MMVSSKKIKVSNCVDKKKIPKQFWYFLKKSMEKNKIKVMGMKQIKDRGKKDWPGSSHWELVPKYQWARLRYLWAGSCDNTLMN